MSSIVFVIQEKDKVLSCRSITSSCDLSDQVFKRSIAFSVLYCWGSQKFVFSLCQLKVIGPTGVAKEPMASNFLIRSRNNAFWAENIVMTFKTYRHLL